MKLLKQLLDKYSGKKILCIFPHPDDETFATGSLLQTAQKLDITTIAVSLTHGELGYSKTAKGDPLYKMREQEFRQAVLTLGVDFTEIGNLPDGKLREEETALRNSIKVYIEKYNPDLVVTYDHGGLTGHPDHIITSVITLELCKEKKIPLLFYVPFGLTRMLNKNPAKEYDSKPEYVQKSFLNFQKANAFFCHHSQLDQKNRVYTLGAYLFLLFAAEWYHLVDFDTEYPCQYFPFVFN